MCLPVIQGLQAILEAAQIQIGGAQRIDLYRVQLAFLDEPRQDRQERLRSQARIAAAAHELKCLHDELDLAYSS